MERFNFSEFREWDKNDPFVALTSKFLDARQIKSEGLDPIILDDDIESIALEPQDPNIPAFFLAFYYRENEIKRLNDTGTAFVLKKCIKNFENLIPVAETRIDEYMIDFHYRFTNDGHIIKSKNNLKLRWWERNNLAESISGCKIVPEKPQVLIDHIKRLNGEY